MAFLRFSSLSYVIVGASAGILAFLCLLLIVFFVFRFSCTFKRRNLSGVRIKSCSSRTTTETREIEEVKVEMRGGGTEREEIVKGGKSSSEVADVGWGRWYSMAELVAATGNFCVGNVVGEGGYGVVYRGVLPDTTVVAVKRLLNNKGQAQREFKVEVEAIGKVRHKNLVGLVGYCDEGSQRMLVYEYLDNGNLEQWLHGKLGATSPLTWDIRMKIAFGTARGLTYLHEGLEPKVVHRDIKSSNILLDKSWNAKVSDFGLAKLLETESSYVRTRVMGTFGYVAPEYASTGMLTEASDVYSFGILLMEIVSGRNPVDYNRPAAEVNLVDWFRYVARNRHSEEILDPLMEAKPSPKALKRILLICLRCVHPDTENRPKIGQVLHMLEGNEFPFRAARGALPDNISLGSGCTSPVLMSGNASPLLDPASGGASPLLAGKFDRTLKPSTKK